MAEFSANAIQTVNPGESVVFTTTRNACRRGFVRHRDDTGEFLLSGNVPFNGYPCCNHNQSAEYLVDFGANIAIPTGGTVGEISLAIMVGNATDPATTMRVTPAAVEEYFNVSRATNVPIWSGCCEYVSIRNTSDQPILVQNANVIFSRPDLLYSR